MRTSTRTPRLSWYPNDPNRYISDPRWLGMNATARGAYHSLENYSWYAHTQGDGLCANPESLRRMSGATELEWDAVKKQVLAFFEVGEDGKLYLPWMREAAADAIEKVNQLKRASEAAQAKKATRKNTDDTDEIDKIDEIYRNGRPNGPSNERPNERPNGQPSPASSHFNGSSSAPPAAASDPFAQKQGSDSSPSSAEPDDEGSAPSAMGEKPEPTGRGNLDAVNRIQEHALQLNWKLPRPRDVQELLKAFSAADICAGMDYHSEKLNGESDDDNYAEYKFFVEGGAAAVIGAMKSENARLGVQQ